MTRVGNAFTGYDGSGACCCTTRELLDATLVLGAAGDGDVAFSFRFQGIVLAESALELDSLSELDGERDRVGILRDRLA